MKFSLKILLILLALLLSQSFKTFSIRHSHNSKFELLDEKPDEPPPSYLEKNKDGSYSDKTNVKEALSSLLALLGPPQSSAQLNGVNTISEEKLMQKVQDGFSKILSDVRKSDLTPMERMMLFTETNMLLNDVKEKGGIDNVREMTKNKKNIIDSNKPSTSLYSDNAAPYLLVYGPGSLGQATLQKLKSFGKAIQLKTIDGEYLSVMPEQEINFAVRDAKTIIFVADSKKVESKDGGWFGGSSSSSSDEWSPVVNEKALKRLLNAAMNEINKNSNQNNIKVVAVGKAFKQPKSLTSFLGGDTTEFDAEVVLQCKKRGLGYAIVKVGQLLEDNIPMPKETKETKYRSVGSLVAAYQTNSSPLTQDEKALAQPTYVNPVVFTSSRVEPSEFTYMSVAVDAVLRSAGHPSMNSTISVLSTPSIPQSTQSPLPMPLTLPTDAQWDDEFLKLDGPELARIPLLFASADQMALRLGRIVEDLKTKGSGLVTPIEVERYSNGARILFRPLLSSYSSSKDEKNSKDNEKKEEGMAKSVAVKEKKARPQGYLSPEQEAEQERQEERDTEERQREEKDKIAQMERKKSSNNAKLEGGLEIIVDTLPYRRVRIRRCNMGPQTIVKEESEIILLKALIRGIQVLENDYRIRLKDAMLTSL